MYRIKDERPKGGRPHSKLEVKKGRPMKGVGLRLALAWSIKHDAVQCRAVNEAR